ncbi:MAG: hypothetical protein ACTHNU_15285, partial [Gaiellales bacterium]
MRVATRVAAAIALGVLPAACATGCGGSSSNSDLTPADVQRFLAVKEATDNFSFLVELINTADGSVRSLETTPGHSAGGLQGAKLSWDHVLLGLNMFHPAQAAAVPGLATTILATRQVAIQWGNALNGVTPHTSHHELTVRFAPVVKL